MARHWSYTTVPLYSTSYTDLGIDERSSSHCPGCQHFLTHLRLVRPFSRKTRSPVQGYLNVDTGFAMEYLHMVHHTAAVLLDDRFELRQTKTTTSYCSPIGTGRSGRPFIRIWFDYAMCETMYNKYLTNNQHTVCTKRKKRNGSLSCT